MRVIVFLLVIIAFSACTTGGAIDSIGKPVSCSDSDGGKSFNTPGTVITESSAGVKTTNTDLCKDGNLVEFYCDGGNFPRSEAVSCDCMNGACI